ncbi:hypothetical protein Q5762_24575 [Streptomyces sp. P9(2023)]|uniref:hypothetical protein n=1 Tax=Streptomyces sp. P9(2023) TaxID=3064394 RepID=UPI0028F3EF19|nr:hypothetical protein [Streptomyces sp. P9(2023)]MDT9691458.1 hypothetical protein [Streptomyces sp. P9(2023)]
MREHLRTHGPAGSEPRLPALHLLPGPAQRRTRCGCAVARTLLLLDRHPDTRHARLDALAAHDAERRTEPARSLLGYLDFFGDVRRCRSWLGVRGVRLRDARGR